MTQPFLYDPEARPLDFFDKDKDRCLRFTFTDLRSPSPPQCEIDQLKDPFIFNGEEVANLKIFTDKVIAELGTSVAIEEGQLSGVFLRLIIQKNTEGEPCTMDLFSRVKKFNLEDTTIFLLVYSLLNQMHRYTII